MVPPGTLLGTLPAGGCSGPPPPPRSLGRGRVGARRAEPWAGESCHFAGCPGTRCPRSAAGISDFAPSLSYSLLSLSLSSLSLPLFSFSHQWRFFLPCKFEIGPESPSPHPHLVDRSQAGWLCTPPLYAPCKVSPILSAAPSRTSSPRCTSAGWANPSLHPDPQIPATCKAGAQGREPGAGGKLSLPNKRPGDAGFKRPGSSPVRPWDTVPRLRMGVPAGGTRRSCHK